MFGKSMRIPAAAEALPGRSRELISKKYFEALSIDEVSQQTSRTVGAAYKALERALQMLSECVRQRLATQNSSQDLHQKMVRNR